MKLFTTRQIAGIDRYTIEREPISDVDLMERAAEKIFYKMISLVSHPQRMTFLAGPGNNGGDALAVARMFAKDDYPCKVCLLDTGKSLSRAAEINFRRLQEQGKAVISHISSVSDFPELTPGTVVVDGLYGSGLTRPLEGLAAGLIGHVNRADCRVISIDMPSGLMGEDNSGNIPEHIVRAQDTITLQFPKISLLFPENDRYAGKIHVVNIQLHPEAIAVTETPYHLTEMKIIPECLPPRQRYAHKGDFGHALLISGSYGKIGAAVLAAGACMRTGAGLLTAFLPSCGYEIMQSVNPEVMCLTDENRGIITGIPDLEKYTAVAAGPGLGTDRATQGAVRQLLDQIVVPLVLDADALNILSLNPDLLDDLPRNTILTPHPGEFRRLFGETPDSWTRLELQRRKSSDHQIIIVLKGAHTTVSLPDGSVWFNPTGNPGMATGGSGDVLTGMLLGLLSQGIPPDKAAMAAVYIHGMAGDQAAWLFSEHSLIASDITRQLPTILRQIYKTAEPEKGYF